MAKVGLLTIATNKYTRYIEPLWESARKHFLPGHDKTLYLFTDSPTLEPVDSFVTPIQHQPWPYITLRRYQTFLKAQHQLAQEEHLYWVDADAIFVDTVGDEIFGKLVGVKHPGFANQPRSQFTYEQRPQSRCCVRPHEGRHYFAGGFNGGAALNWLAACQTMAAWIAEDEARGIMPLWSDESALNRYFIDHPPDVVLEPTYLCPESWQMPGRKLLCLDKDHFFMRS